MNADRAIIIISDIEVSTGGMGDDFPHSDYFLSFFQKYNLGEFVDREVDLVFNGDTLDFLKTDIDGLYPHLIDENIALIKLELIAEAHPKFFEAISIFLAHPGKARRVHFIVGNHDQEILFPKVQDRIIELCGGSGQVMFPGFEMRIGDMLIEHGSQKDSLFQVPADAPFVDFNGKKILNLPWASVTLLNVFMPIHHEIAGIDRIIPKMVIAEKHPELKEILLGALWRYWTQDYMKSVYSFDDPLKKISWNMIKEALKRTFSFDPNVGVGDHYVQKMVKESFPRLHVIGHTHEPKVYTFGDRKVIQAGCFRHEFMLDVASESYSLIPKSYVEVLMQNNRVVLSNMLEVEGPIPSNEYYPKPLKEYIDFIKSKFDPEATKVNKVNPSAETH